MPQWWPLPHQLEQKIEIHNEARFTFVSANIEVPAVTVDIWKRGAADEILRLVTNSNTIRNCLQRDLSAVRGIIVSRLPPEQGDPGKARTSRTVRLHKSLYAVTSLCFLRTNGTDGSIKRALLNVLCSTLLLSIINHWPSTIFRSWNHYMWGML